MTLTVLESLLTAAFCSLITVLVVRARSVSPERCGEYRKTFEERHKDAEETLETSVSSEECEERRRVNREMLDHLDRAIREIRITNNIQFRMLRALVAHSQNMTDKEKAEILNMSDGERALT